MGNAEQILVIVLAATLALFLLLAVVATVKIIQILNRLKIIVEKAEKLANTAETVGEFFKYTAGPAALGKLVSNVTEAFRNHKHKKD
ncbi:MAG TPA: hypothetical protein VLF87_03025 [Patescibacteria group bacterium]|nr:hypothetical protein [Patescibacteria group bacterium]